MAQHVPSIPPHRVRLTMAEYVELPDDGKRHEVIDGDLHVTPAPGTRHQRVSRRLQTILILALERTGRGEVFDAPVDVVLGPHDIVQPDLVFIRAERAGIVEPKNIQGAPDLVVEILSDSTRRTDVLVKSRLYARCGVASYWILDPEIDRMEMFRLEGDRYVLAAVCSSPEVARPPELPGLEIPLAEVFA